MGSSGLLLLALSAIAVVWPRLIVAPLAVIGVWVAISLFIRAFHLHREGRREELELNQELKSVEGERALRGHAGVTREGVDRRA
jgi:hypothetical protein